MIYCTCIGIIDKRLKGMQYVHLNSQQLSTRVESTTLFFLLHLAGVRNTITNFKLVHQQTYCQHGSSYYICHVAVVDTPNSILVIVLQCSAVIPN